MDPIELSPDDLNADWIKHVRNPVTGKTSRQSELELHAALQNRSLRQLISGLEHQLNHFTGQVED